MKSKEIFVWGILFILVLARFWGDRYLGGRRLADLEGKGVRISTRITSDPIRYTNFQSIEVSGFRAYLSIFPEISYGDFVTIEAKVAKGRLGEAKLIEKRQTEVLLFKLRKRLLEFYQGTLPTPHDALVSGIILGAKSALPKDFWESLKNTGTAHVVVASGMNVTFVVGFLISFFSLVLPRRKAIPLAVVGIWIYVLLSGFDAPIIRAAVMGSLAFAGQELGKVVPSLRILIFTALSMLLIKPQWLTDLGFILSFVATLSLILFERKINGKLSFVPVIFREGVSTSLAAQIGVAPILFVTFGNFNIASPIINALVLWTIPYIMIIGGVAGAFGLLLPWVGRLLLYLLYPLTLWFVGTVRFLG